MNIKPLSFSSIRTVSLAGRDIETDEEDFGAPYQAGSGFADFLCSLPNVGASSVLFALRDAIVAARRHKHAVTLVADERAWETGLSPLISRLIEQRIITALVLNGTAMQQDVEIALTGGTVQANGSASITDETGKVINDAIDFGASENFGIGESVGRTLNDLELEHLDHSAIATACRYGVPVSVHPMLGADSYTLHPKAHGESTGSTAVRDLRLLAGIFAESSHGVLINTASDRALMRVLVQALNAALNLGKSVDKLTCGNINGATGAASTLRRRLQELECGGHNLPGPAEIMTPLLFAAVIDAMGTQTE